MGSKSIFDSLPDHLHLSRNSKADKNDRWRIYNTVNKKYIQSTGAPTAEQCMRLLKVLYVGQSDKMRQLFKIGEIDGK